MFSTRKGLIRIVELTAIACSIACLVVAVLVARGSINPLSVSAVLFPSLLVEFGISWVTFTLAAELLRARGKREEAAAGNLNLSLSEWRMLHRWCPFGLRLAYAVALVVAVYAFLAIGFGVSWRTGEPFTEHEALGFALFGALFVLVQVPTLASASRMPGTYAEHFHHWLKRRDDA
jgi:hypothetical protein